MEIKAIKKTVLDGVPTITYLVFNDTKYVATVDFECFTSKCKILDSEHTIESSECCNINLAILQKIQEEFNSHNLTRMVPPPPHSLIR